MSDVHVKELAKVFDGDLDLVLFFLEWVKNGQNGTKAYIAMNPGTDPATAATLASRLLKKVDITTILETYGLGLETYMTQLKDGMQAEKSDMTGMRYPDHMARKPYHDTLGKLLGVDKIVPAVAIQVNNYSNLNDEQLDQLIAAKLRQTGARSVTGGETAPESTQPAEVHPAAPEAARSE